tara:strand:+ start:243 stop:431 length:189 start_codon:yes stop_codon:yes gene_type:complete
MAMQNATEISRVVLVVSHPETFDVLTDIIDDLSRAKNYDRSIIDYDSQNMCRLNTEGEVELG